MKSKYPENELLSFDKCQTSRTPGGLILGESNHF